MKFISVFYLVFFLITANASNDPYKTIAGNIEFFEECSEAGEVKCQLALGVALMNGAHIDRNIPKAFILLTKAANQGSANAHLHLHYLYKDGLLSEGVNLEKSFKHLKQGAELDFSIAQLLLGSAYALGEGVKQDHKLALVWYKKSADSNDAIAQLKVGDFYYSGYGVKKDYAEAWVWYKKSAMQGEAQALFGLGELKARGAGVEKNSSEALAYLRLSVEYGDKTASNFIPRVKNNMTDAEVERSNEFYKAFKSKIVNH